MMTGVEPIPVTLHVNGLEHRVLVEPRKLLSDVLREDCGLTGTHVGCEHGVCGACTVLVDGRPSAIVPDLRRANAGARDHDDRRHRSRRALDRLQQALHEAHGLQCGFCTPGIVMTMEAWLAENPDPTEAEIREALSGNLCRCTGYHNIVTAITKAAKQRKPEPPKCEERKESAE